MSKTTNRVVITAFATAGFYGVMCAFSSVSLPASALPGLQGVPCVNAVDGLINSPGGVPSMLQNFGNAAAAAMPASPEELLPPLGAVGAEAVPPLPPVPPSPPSAAPAPPSPAAPPSPPAPP